MKEVAFIRRGIDRWRGYEAVAKAGREASPDDVADAYTDTLTDLSFAQTHYPRSRVTLYLNNLALTLHNNIYRPRRERWSRLRQFWAQDVPMTMWQARAELRVSFVVFVVSMVIGAVSQWLEPDFCRLIMGNRYVEMTLENIENGEPMGVYGSMSEGMMFASITINNIYVSFVVFVMGLFTSLGTGFMLLRNGVMLGSFQTFFAQHGLLWQSTLAVWLHGTLEISAIIVAGAAGLRLGNGWLFPGTYSRLYSFRQGARSGVKIVVGTVPIFCMAGFIESFLTRHTDMGDWLRLSIIGLSAAFVIYYYVILPYNINKNNGTERKKN